MLGKTSLLIAVGLGLALPLAGKARAESFTTRIEPRPFYGAVVTLEEGVRVIRPLPPERQVIINPNGTPLNLGFNDTRVVEESRVYNYNNNQNSSGGYGYGPPAILGAPYFGRGLNKWRGFNRGPGGGFHRGPHGGGGVR